MDLYKNLNLSKDANADDIKKSYRRLARKYHPDVSKEEGAEENFKAVQKAYEVLSDPERRAHYDRTGQTRQEDPERAAMEMLAQAFATALRRTLEKPTDQVSAANRVLGEMQDTVNREINSTKNAVKKLKRHLGMVKTKDPHSINIYENIVKMEIERAEGMLQNYPKVLSSIERARKLLKEFEAVAPDNNAQPPDLWQKLYTQYGGSGD